MIYLINIILFISYLLLNIFFFNQLKNLFKFLFFVILYLSIFFFILKKNEYIILYLILHFLFIISFKFFSYLFFETSPTLYLSEIFSNKITKNEAQEKFLKNIFIDKYKKNLINQKLIGISDNKIFLKKSGLIFLKFFYFLFRFMFK